MYNPQLSSYWDLHTCGKASDNNNWAWCWNGSFSCQSIVLVASTVCPSGRAVLNFTRQLSKLDGCTFGYYAQYVCTSTTTSIVMSTTSTTSAATTTTTTTTRPIGTTQVPTTTTTSPKLIQGLTPAESAVYNPQLASYWDLETCGKATDDHNWAWCWHVGFGCQHSVQSGLCLSGEAVLNFTLKLSRLDNCTFGYYAQYVCKPLAVGAEEASGHD